MKQQTPDCKSGTTVEFEGDVFLLLLEAMRQVAKQERADVGTEVLLSALVSGDSAAGSAIAPSRNDRAARRRPCRARDRSDKVHPVT